MCYFKFSARITFVISIFFFKFQVSRFFGVTGTTSQDIQLGLTFTVPFLSIPLTSLQSALGGGGLSGIFDNFNFDVSSLVSIVVIVMLAIFVLPQVIYWLTGVNLSAFNWGRSKLLVHQFLRECFFWARFPRNFFSHNSRTY